MGVYRVDAVPGRFVKGKAKRKISDVNEKVANADQRGNEWLMKGREAQDRGDQARADECFRKGNFWLARSNKLRGEC